jgi:hypothetical protein
VGLVLALGVVAGCAGSGKPSNLAPGWIGELPGPEPMATIAVSLERMRADPIYRGAMDRDWDTPRIWPGLAQARQLDAYIWVDAVEPRPRWEALVVAHGVEGQPGPASPALEHEALASFPVALEKVGASTWLLGFNPGRRWRALIQNAIEPRAVALAPGVQAVLELDVAKSLPLTRPSRMTRDAEGLELVRAELYGVTQKDWIRIDAWFDSEANAARFETMLGEQYGAGRPSAAGRSARPPRDALAFLSLFTIEQIRSGRQLTVKASLTPWLVAWLTAMQAE